MRSYFNKAGRLCFDNGYERMAFVTLEVATGAQTQRQLAAQLKLSEQRLSQIVKAGYGFAGCRPGDPPEKVGAGFRRKFTPPVTRNSIEAFTANELTFRGEFDPYA